MAGGEPLYDADTVERVRAFTEEGLSQYEISRRLGLSHSKINRIAVANNLRKMTRNEANAKRWTAYQLGQRDRMAECAMRIQQLALEGLTRAMIASRVNMSQSRVSEYLSSMGFRGLTTSDEKPERRVSEVAINYAYKGRRYQDEPSIIKPNRRLSSRYAEPFGSASSAAWLVYG